MRYNREQETVVKKVVYLVNAMDEINKNGDAYCTGDRLYRYCRSKQPSLAFARYNADKAQLLHVKVFHQEGRRLYDRWTWEHEEAAAQVLADILSDNSLMDATLIPSSLGAMGGIALNEQQRAAIIMALSHRLSLILGGAGSGKTTLIQTLVSLYTEQRGSFDNVVVAAPTGKAARNLTERTAILARTVHSALGKVPDEKFLDPVNWQFTSLVVIDEASMLTLEMLAGILNRVPRSCRVVLLGDPNQLMSVGAGNVIPDLLALGVPSVRLEQQYRQNAGALRHNVVEFPHLTGLTQLKWDESFRIIDAEDSIIADIICREAARRYQAGESVQVLSPTNRTTDFSVHALNRRLQDMLNPMETHKQTWGPLREGDRILVTQNDSNLGVSNGDVGTLRIRDVNGIKGLKEITLELGLRRAVWEVGEEAEPNNLALAYALTVHKSQGSQYDTVILPVSLSTSGMLYRNLLYTAISRAKKEVILVGNINAVHTAMQRVPYPRKSMLVSKTNMLRCKRSA